MGNAKIENLLNLALDASQEEREKSGNLGIGFSPAKQTWEVIVRYVRNGLDRVRELLVEYGYEDLVSKITELSNSYAVLILPESLVDIMAGLDEIIYMEKPKRLFFAVCGREFGKRGRAFHGARQSYGKRLRGSNYRQRN